MDVTCELPTLICVGSSQVPRLLQVVYILFYFKYAIWRLKLNQVIVDICDSPVIHQEKYRRNTPNRFQG